MEKSELEKEINALEEAIFRAVAEAVDEEIMGLLRVEAVHTDGQPYYESG